MRPILYRATALMNESRARINFGFLLALRFLLVEIVRVESAGVPLAIRQQRMNTLELLVILAKRHRIAGPANPPLRVSRCTPGIVAVHGIALGVYPASPRFFGRLGHRLPSLSTAVRGGDHGRHGCGPRA